MHVSIVYNFSSVDDMSQSIVKYKHGADKSYPNQQCGRRCNRNRPQAHNNANTYLFIYLLKLSIARIYERRKI